MPTLDVSAVTYVGLPIPSGGAHSLGRMRLRAAHERTIGFLNTCCELANPLAYEFFLVDQAPTDPGIEREFRDRFGEGPVSNDRVADALDFLEEIEPQPSDQGLAPIWLAAKGKFKILDPDTGKPLPGQDSARFAGKEYQWESPLGTSGMKLSLSNTGALSIDLCLPDVDDIELARLATWLQSHLPCKLSPKHWKRWTPTKSGTSFVGRKIPPPAIK